MSPTSTVLSHAAPAELRFELHAPQAPLHSTKLPVHSHSRVLRTRAFLGRTRPVKVADYVRPLIEAHREFTPQAWVHSAAVEIAERSTLNVPVEWLERLSSAIHSGNKSAAHPSFDDIPKAVLNDPSFLSGVLEAARACAAPERKGRSGRVSAGSVYTPALVAKHIIAELKVGARRVIDPACGAGAFLLEAFQRGYRRRLEGGEAPAAAAQSVLSNELTGIDIDREALAVAEFSLRIAALRMAGLSATQPIDLRLSDALKPLPGLEGACECLVGNPPFIEGRGLSPAVLDGLRGRFQCASEGKVNLFAVFIERSLELLKDDGVMALIVPATFQRNARYRLLRELLLKHTIESMRPLEREQFGNHAVETVVLRVRKRPPQSSSRVKLGGGEILQSRLPMGPVLRFCDHLPRRLRHQIELMERHGAPLSNFFEVRDGISTGFQPFPVRLLGNVTEDTTPMFVSLDGHARPFDPAIHRKIIDGSEFTAFSPIAWEGRYIEYDKRHEHTPPHPGRPFNCQLRDPSLYDRAEKIVTRQTACGLIATLDRERHFVRNSVHVTFQKPEHASLSLEALCACLNSRFYIDYFLAVTGETGEIFPQVHIADLKRLPVLPGLLKPGGVIAELGSTLLQIYRNTEIDLAAMQSAKVALETELAAAFGL